jgi:hypothetical protein
MILTLTLGHDTQSAHLPYMAHTTASYIESSAVLRQFRETEMKGFVDAWHGDGYN